MEDQALPTHLGNEGLCDICITVRSAHSLLSGSRLRTPLEINVWLCLPAQLSRQRSSDVVSDFEPLRRQHEVFLISCD